MDDAGSVVGLIFAPLKAAWQVFYDTGVQATTGKKSDIQKQLNANTLKDDMLRAGATLPQANAAASEYLNNLAKGEDGAINLWLVLGLVGLIVLLVTRK